MWPIVALIVAVLVARVLWVWAEGRDKIRDYRITGLCPECGQAVDHVREQQSTGSVLGHWHCLACGWEADRREEGH